MGEAKPVVAGIRFTHQRELARGPVKLARIDHDSTNACAMPTQPFGERMHNDISTMLQRTH